MPSVVVRGRAQRARTAPPDVAQAAASTAALPADAAPRAAQLRSAHGGAAWSHSEPCVRRRCFLGAARSGFACGYRHVGACAAGKRARLAHADVAPQRRQAPCGTSLSMPATRTRTFKRHARSWLPRVHVTEPGLRCEAGDALL